MRTPAILALFVFWQSLLLPFTASAFEVGGMLAGDQEWKFENSPVLVKDHVMIPKGASLKIAPGVTVLFQGYYQLMVKGTLEAVGDAKRMIVFTCEQKEARRSLWKGLVLSGEDSKAVLSDCIFEYAFRNLCMVSGTVVRSCVFRHNHYALYFSGSTQAMVNGNRFFNNSYAVYCDRSSPVLQGNIISSNEFGVFCIFSSSPLIGQNVLEKNTKEDLFLDDSMGKNSTTIRNQYLWMLVRGLL